MLVQKSAGPDGEWPEQSGTKEYSVIKFFVDLSHIDSINFSI